MSSENLHSSISQKLQSTHCSTHVWIDTKLIHIPTPLRPSRLLPHTNPSHIATKLFSKQLLKTSSHTLHPVVSVRKPKRKSRKEQPTTTLSTGKPRLNFRHCLENERVKKRKSLQYIGRLGLCGELKRVRVWKNEKTGKMLYDCECEQRKPLIHKVKILKHARLHDIEVFQCAECDTQFKHHLALNAHMKVHSGSK